MADNKLDLGVKQFSLGGKVSVEFNPTDLNFLEHLMDIIADLDNKQSEYETRVKGVDIEGGLAAAQDFFDIVHEAEEYMRGRLDDLFGVEVSEPLLGDVSIYARNTDGLPIWLGILFAIFDQMEVANTQADRDAAKRIQKYTAKYRRK